MARHRAKLDGARAVGGVVAVGAASEPDVIYRILSRHYRAGSLWSRDLAARMNYGRAMLAPDADKSRDFRSCCSGVAALERALCGGQIVA